jgi:hypothetical protein
MPARSHVQLWHLTRRSKLEPGRHVKATPQ